MKKRLSKLALLAVAAAFVLVGFPACGDDDDDEPPLPATATIAGEDIPEDGLALTAGTPQDVTATVTLTNGIFSDEAKSLDEGDTIPEGYLTLEAGEGITIKDVKVAAPATDTDMKITFTVTAADGAEAGAITATLEPGTVKDYTEAITATGAISYSVTAASENPPENPPENSGKQPPENPTEKTLTVTLTGDNVPANGVSLATGEEKTGNATLTVANGTFSDAVKALDAGEAIPDTILTLNAGSTVAISNVKVATKATDTTMEIILTVTAGNEAGEGAIKATLKAGALKDYDNAITAGGGIAYIVKEKETVAGIDYEWNFQEPKLVTLLSYKTNEGGSLSATEVAKVTLEAAGTYESTPAGLTLNIPEGGTFNKVAPNGSVSSTYKIEASKGSIEPDGTTVLTVEATGPFTAVMLCGANSSTDKADRYAFIKINDKEVSAPLKEENKLPATGQTLSYTYEGTDTVTVAFGGTNVVRIHDIKITTAKIDATDKTAGEVMSKATFVSMTDDSTTNDEATLGLVGTEAKSSDTNVATVSITNDGKIAITSVAAGNTIITVRNAEKNEATIEVSVSGTGAISVRKIEKYDGTVYFTIEDGTLNLVADKYAYPLSKGNLEATDNNNSWTSASADALDNTTAKSGKTYFTESNAVVNMSDPARSITLKVKGVAAIDVHVFDSNGDRPYTVKVGNADAVTYKSVKNEEGNIIATNTTDTVTIVIAGINKANNDNKNTSVYPVGVILYKEVPTSADDSAE